MQVLKVSYNNPKSNPMFCAKHFTMTTNQRIDAIATLEQYLPKFPEYSEYLGKVIKESPSFIRLSKEVKVNPHNVKNFYTSHIDDLITKMNSLKSKIFANKLGDLLNSIKNADSAINLAKSKNIVI